MLRIDCPYCGQRDEADFRCGGESHISRPSADVDDATWSDYLFNRDNPKGLTFERWCHVFGCGRWFNLVRSTTSHEILAIYEMGQPKPTVNQEEHSG